MNGEEQRKHCEVCDFHKIILCSSGIKIMSCHYGDYRNHPVWGDFRCPLGDNKPTREDDTNTDFF